MLRDKLIGISLIALVAQLTLCKPRVIERKETVPIAACILNAEEWPEDPNRIEESLKYATDMLREHANIELTVCESNQYKGNLTNLVLKQEQALNPHYSCNKPHDIALLFTSVNNLIRVKTGEKFGYPLRGEFYINNSYGIIYGPLSGEENAHKITTAHELGHAFNLGHNSNNTDVMYHTIKPDEPSFQSFEILKRYKAKHVTPRSWTATPQYIQFQAEELPSIDVD